ncbi:MAG: hypothetical protein A2145_04940, partial [candidate division Zixibacteria bacterium RBG_16_40_9]
ALVTGCAKGIGNWTAQALAKAGADTVINYKTSQKEALKLSESIQKMGRKTLVIKADVTKPNEVQKLFKQAEKRFGKVDILVNNVGNFIIKSIYHTTYNEWKDIIETNLTSVFLCSKAALPKMRERKWGRIINMTVATVDKQAAAPKVAHYTAAKTGVLILTKSLAAEEVKNGITVNSVGPGIVDTGIMSEAEKKDLIRLCPKGRFAKPEEIARVILFLASPESDYITGANIPVGGGWGL